MKDGLRKMLEGKDFCAVDIVFPFAAAFLDEGLGLEQQCKLTRTSVQYSDTTS